MSGFQAQRLQVWWLSSLVSSVSPRRMGRRRHARPVVLSRVAVYSVTAVATSRARGYRAVSAVATRVCGVYVRFSVRAIINN